MLDFLGIGAQKAGTTWLYRMLSRHPQIEFPAGKEIHFWDRWYQERSLDWYRDLFAGAAPGIKQGEITPAYAILEPSIIRRIHAFQPHLRLFYLLRNPIDRAWSSALMALERAEMTPEEASDAWFLDHFRSAGSLARGDYERCLRHWLAVFPREQLLLLRHEQIVRDPVGLLAGCCRHLDIAEGFFATLPAGELAQKVFPGPGYPIRPALLPFLRECYAPRIRRLESFLGEDFSVWLG